MDALHTLHTTSIPSLDLIARGKVRDIYAIDSEHMLIVTSDRISAFDCILPDPIPGKGEVLTAVSNFWFERLKHIVPNHLTGIALADVIPDAAVRSKLEGRAIVVKRLKALPIEAVVRGYLIGSGWKDYQAKQQVCGIDLPKGLRLAEKLPEAIFTPSTKAELGLHDENISLDKAESIIGRDLAHQAREVSLQLYQAAFEHAHQRGIIIADTKFEFGLSSDGTLHLIDEALTPDSSRFWAKEAYQVGTSPSSYDKQFVRDYLESLDWDKTPPAPNLPQDVIEKTMQKYQEAKTRLLSEKS